MITLPVWLLILVNLPSILIVVAIFVLAIVFGVKEACSSRREFKEESEHPITRAFRSGEEAIERKCCIPFTKDKLEALNELLLFSMDEMMSINTKDRFQNILDEEQREALHEKMDFCALMLKELRHFSKDT